MSRIIRSESAIVAMLADTAKAPRLEPIDPAVIGRTRAAIRRHRTKRRLFALAIVVATCATIGAIVAMVAL